MTSEPAPPFVPCAVAEVDIDLERPLGDLAGLGAYTRVLVLVRLRGVPVGYVSAPVTDGAVTGRALGRRISESLEDRLVRRAIAARLLSGASVPTTTSNPVLTIIVCTRNRPEDLADCLSSLEPLVDERHEVLVVDNAPSDDRTERVVHARNRPMRYVREDRPGLSWARRCGVALANGQFVAFVDDDVRVDAAWAEAVVSAFAEAGVMAVLGLVAPAELDTRAQQDFEWHGGFGRGFDRRWLRRATHQAAAPAFANTGTFGTGANMAFRRTIFSEVGLFDTALGAGTPAEGGEDLDMIFRILEAGHTVVYEPAALVWHRHRRDDAALRSQVISWGRGMSAYLARSWVAYPEARQGLLTLAAQLLCLYHPRRVLQSVFDPRLRLRLTIPEWYGAWTGARRYLTTAEPVEPSPSGRSMPGEVRGRPAGSAPQPRARVDLDGPLPDALAMPSGASTIGIEVILGGQPIGVVHLPADGQRLSPHRLVDTIVASVDVRRLDADGAVKRSIRATLTGVDR